MKEIDVVRAWKDEEYRAGLSESELRSLPDNPAWKMTGGQAMQMLPITFAFTYLTYYTPTLFNMTITMK